MVDFERSTGRTLDQDRLVTGWGGHLARRAKLFEIITEASPRDGDMYFPVARRRQSRIRPILALNKPGIIPGNPVVTIPERFRDLV
jgi:hypothetical protein